MRNFVNLCLLVCFIVLCITGIFSFIFPFDLITTRIHIVFGFLSITFVGLHLAERLKYFVVMFSQQRKKTSDKKRMVSRKSFWFCLGSCLVLLVSAWFNTFPAKQFVSLSYESRHYLDIVRASMLRLSRQEHNKTNHFVQQKNQKGIKLRVDVTYSEKALRLLSSESNAIKLALWAETSEIGKLIETLFLSEDLTFKEKVEWQGEVVGREKILPIWRHRYTLFTGKEPGEANVDAVTSATPMHSFSIEAHIKANTEFTLVLELNQENDKTPSFPEGEPSIIYTTIIDVTDVENKYYLLAKVGHGGGDASISGEPFYDFTNIADSKDLIEKVLVYVELIEQKQ